MSIIFGLLPLLVLAGIVWAIVGALRKGSGEPLTLATATAFYANLMMLVGILGALVGLGDAIKVGLAAVNVGYSYHVYNRLPPCAGPVERCGPGAPQGYIDPSSAQYVDQQRSQDLVLAITLIVIGAAVLLGHHLLFRAVRDLRGGSPVWIVRGRWIALTAICGLIGLGSAAVAVYSTASFFVLSTSSRQPFGDPLGLAIAFLPAWGFAVSRLLRDVRSGSPAAQEIGPA